MTKTFTCPDVNLLDKLATAELPPDEMEPLLDHLQECTACLARVQEAFPRDTLADLVTKVKTLPGEPQDPHLSSVIERLSSLGQTPPPALGAPAPATVQHDNTELPLSAASGPGLAGVSPRSTPSTADATQGLPPQQGDPETLDYLRPAQQPDELGRLGQYRILKKLGAGGMGLVFLAEDTLLNRKVALKLMLPHFAANASARERFLREARSAASIEHEHIVPIFQVGEDNNVPFLAMPFLKGEPLDVRIEREGKLPVAEALRIAREMAEGLAAAHANNLIHRDIKPGNIWLESASPLSPLGRGIGGEGPLPPLSPLGRGVGGEGGKVKLLDFGLARGQDDTTHLTQTGVLVGTPAYMAPEQARAEPIDGRADLFSLGCVLYLMLTGERPFKGKDTMSVLMSLALENPTLPTTLIPEVPAAVSDLTMRLLAKDAGARPANAQAVVDALRALEARDGTEILVKPGNRTAAPQQKNAAPRLWVPLFVGIGVAAALLLLIGGYAIYQIIIIRDKDGKEIARIKVPDGARIEIIPDGKSVDPKHTPWAATPEQQVWLDAVARVTLPQRIEAVKRRMGEENKVPVTLVLEPQDGPPTKCKVTEMNRGDAKVIWPLLALPSLTSLDLTATAVTDFTPLARLPLTELVARVIVDNVKSEAALKSMATLKTVNGRPAAEHWAERTAIRKEIDDTIVKAPALSLQARLEWFNRVMKKLNPKWSGQAGGGLSKDNTSGLITLSFILGFSEGPVYDFSPVRALGVEAVHLQRVPYLCDLSPLAKSKVQIFRYVESFGSLRDISPLAGLPLKELDLTGTNGLTDLSPLAGMKLESFQLFHYSSVTDVKVLLDMPLTSLALPHTITDLRPFKTMKLTSLGSSATDLAPLAGMPLEILRFRGSRPADLSPLAGMKLKHYSSIDFNGYWWWFRSDYEPDEKMFRAMPLVSINSLPAAEFWAAYDADRKALQEFVTATAKLAPAEAVAAVNEALKKKARALADSRIEDGAVVEVKLSPHQAGKQELNPLGPLKAFPRLKKLTIADNGQSWLWPNLAPLMNLPIEEIVCDPATVAGNAIILRQMPTLKTINGKPAKEVLK